MSNRIILFPVLCIVVLFSGCIQTTNINSEKSEGPVYNVLDFGADPTGNSKSTEAINKAIQKANKNGGGKVIIPPGTFLSGCIQLKSNITLDMMPGSKILGSPDKEDYPKFRRPIFQFIRKEGEPEMKMMHLIFAKDCENISIQGSGTIDGNGKVFWEEFNEDSLPTWIHAQKGRVSNMVEIQNCKDVTIRDVKLTMSPEWTMHIFGSKNILVDGVRIDNGVFGPNNDGIDVTSSENIQISNCNIITCDDAICFKTGWEGGILRNATVTNCVIKTNCVALKLGSNMTFQDIRDVTFSNCAIYESSRGIGFYSTKGAVFENIVCSNITCNTRAPLVLNRPIHFSVWRKSRGAAQVTKPSVLRNISISNFTATTDGRILMVAEKGCVLENVSLRNIKMIYPFVEDPAAIAPGHKSSQGSPMNPEARGARAAIVAENMKNLSIEGLQVIWPSDTVPEEWKIPVRIENGTDRKFRYGYDKPKQAEMSVFWGKNIQNGYIDLGDAKPSSPEVPEVILQNSQFDVFRK